MSKILPIHPTIPSTSITYNPIIPVAAILCYRKLHFSIIFSTQIISGIKNPLCFLLSPHRMLMPYTLTSSQLWKTLDHALHSNLRSMVALSLKTSLCGILWSKRLCDVAALSHKWWFQLMDPCMCLVWHEITGEGGTSESQRAEDHEAGVLGPIKTNYEPSGMNLLSICT